MAREFLYANGMRHVDGTLSYFCSHSSGKVACLERCNSHAKEWTKKFFFVSSHDWEFPFDEETHCEFPIRTIQGQVSYERAIAIILSKREQAHMRLVYA